MGFKPHACIKCKSRKVSPLLGYLKTQGVAAKTVVMGHHHCMFHGWKNSTSDRMENVQYPEAV